MNNVKKFFNNTYLIAGERLSSNDKSREVINNLSEGKSQQDIENALNSGFAKYDDNGNIINTISLYNDVNDNNKGTHQNSTGNNYINSAYTDMKNTSDVLKVASHENAHNYTKNEDLANASQKYTAFSYFMGNVANLDSVNKNGIATNTSWNNTYGNTQHMNYNTSVVRSIGAGDRSNKVIEVSRNLNNDISKKLNNGKHSYLIIKPNYPEDFMEDKLMKRGLNPDKFKLIDIGGGEMGLVNGGYNDENAKNNPDGKNHLISTINQDTDLNLTREINNNVANKDYNPETRVIRPQNGMSDSTFIYNILDNINNYQNNTKNNPVEYKILNQNCNTYSNSLLDYSGADKNRDNNMKGIDPGKNNRININNFR